MLQIAILIWVVSGLIANSWYWHNQSISVDNQKALSFQIGKDYAGPNWREAILLTLTLIVMLIISILGGTFWLTVQLDSYKKIANRRKQVEDASQKMFKHGWCS